MRWTRATTDDARTSVPALQPPCLHLGNYAFTDAHSYTTNSRYDLRQLLHPPTMAPSATYDAPMAVGRNSPKTAPAKLWTVSDTPFEGYRPIDSDGYARSNHETAIVIDNGE
jgi:hypothetical protein